MYLKIYNVADKTQVIMGMLYHDVDGNMIVKVGEEYYCLWINRDDDLEFMELNYENMVKVGGERDDNIAYREIRSTQERFSLKSKILEEMEKERKKEEGETEDFDEAEAIMDDDIDIKTYYRCYPEEKNYYVDRSGDGDISEDVFNFSRSSSNNNDIKCLDRTMDIGAVYDTFVSGKGKEILFTAENVEKSSYRVTFNFDDIVELNIVGAKVKKYVVGYESHPQINLKMIQVT